MDLCLFPLLSMLFTEAAPTSSYLGSHVEVSAQPYELCVVEGEPPCDCVGLRGPLGSRALEASRFPAIPSLNLKKRGNTQRTLSLCSGIQGLAGAVEGDMQ